MGIRLYVYEKSPYENYGKTILDGGSFRGGIINELEDCEIVNKRNNECESRKQDLCKWCDCSNNDHIKLTYEQLFKINKEILSKNTNLIVSFCLKKENCKLDKVS